MFLKYKLKLLIFISFVAAINSDENVWNTENVSKTLEDWIQNAEDVPFPAQYR
jgi:hypothetical protein